VRSDSTIADLHYFLQIAFGWSDTHLNRFHIHGQDFGVRHDGGIRFLNNPHQVKLSDFQFRTNEKFLYEYDFGDGWQQQVRVEKHLALAVNQLYPCCIGGQRSAPPEDCGGPLSFMTKRDGITLFVAEFFEDIREELENNDLEAVRDLVVEMGEMREWLTLDHFDRRAVNRRLKQYANNDEAWMWT